MTWNNYPEFDVVRQQVDLRDNPLAHREYRALSHFGPICGAVHWGKLPAHVSFSSLAAFIKDVCDEPVRTGQIAKTLKHVSESLKGPYEEALEKLRSEPILNIDETGHKENGKRFWFWVQIPLLCFIAWRSQLKATGRS